MTAISDGNYLGIRDTRNNRFVCIAAISVLQCSKSPCGLANPTPKSDAPDRKAPEELAAFDTRANVTDSFSADLAGAFDASFDIDMEVPAERLSDGLYCQHDAFRQRAWRDRRGRFVANRQLQAVGFDRGEVSTAYNKADASARLGKLNAKITTDCTFAVDTDLH
jgi:hypothetical protein